MDGGATDGEVSDEDEAAELEDDSVKEQVKEKKKAKQKLAKELSDCVTICQSVSFKSFEHSENNCKSLNNNVIFCHNFMRNLKVAKAET